MSHPVLWWKTIYFYPIGNSPPVCLTQDLAPQENAQILLLGCGDPRSILHTIHVGLGDGSRKLDFTCCDIETAVLARNMLLMAMIADGISSHYLWRIFYHFYLDSDTLQVLLSQCRVLIQASADLKTWNASTYGKYLRFCTERSLIEIRGTWELYLSLDGLPEPQMRALRKSFSSSMKLTLQTHATLTNPTGAVSAYRACGPLGSSSFSSSDIQNDLFRSFWSTGIMKGRTPHPPASHINPMFAFSFAGREFNTEDATHAFAAFHLAPVLAKSSTHPIHAEGLVDAIMTQFSEWCKSFHTQVNTADPSITIRFFAGDCFLYCKALRKFHTTRDTKTGMYARPWGLSQIDFTPDYSKLESPAPTIFNIIETSNLGDHLGLLNILLVTVPLLQLNPWSVLHTNTVHDSGGFAAPGVSSLSDKLFADLSTLCLFLGVSPVSRLSDFSTHSPKDTIWSLSWKYPPVVTNKPNPYPELEEDAHVLVCDELQLGNFLYSVCIQMFAEEGISLILSRTPESLQRQHFVHYTRASFVEFLSLIHRRVPVDWTKAFTCFLRLCDSDQNFSRGFRQSYQDLACQLYLTNLAAYDELKWSFLRNVRSPGDSFEGWDSVPPVVSVTLKVPRACLKIMEDIDRTELGVPILHCLTTGPNVSNAHSSIRLTFGDIIVAGHHQDARVVIQEDLAGWQGTSPLIVSFDAPSYIFTKAGDIKRITLSVRPSPKISTLLLDKLGNMDLAIFTTLITDNEHIITRTRPNETQDICRLDSDDRRPGLVETNASRRSIINVGFSHTSPRANSLTLRHTIEDQDIAKTLAAGVPVSTKAVADTVVLVSFQGYEQLFRYPIPISGDKIKTRIARKSSYIEIVAPIRQGTVGLRLNPFPIVHTLTSFNLVNIHYINLSRMPTLDLSVSRGELRWLSAHLAVSFPGQDSSTPGDVAAELKKSISSIFLKSSGLEKRSTIFELSSPTISVYAVIFVNALKLDLSECQTVAADACVIPLNEKNSSKVISMLRRGPRREISMIHTSDEEMELWKALLPAAAESCRTWQHGDDCEYRKRGVPACNEEKLASPLCQCGLGKDLGTFASLAAWKELQSEATRVAIPALYPFPHSGSPSRNVNNRSMEIPGRAGGNPGTPAMSVCGHCSGPGQPTLLLCGRCKKISYCSQKCQKAHWKSHKPACTTS